MKIRNYVKDQNLSVTFKLLPFHSSLVVSYSHFIVLLLCPSLWDFLKTSGFKVLGSYQIVKNVVKGMKWGFIRSYNGRVTRTVFRLFCEHDSRFLACALSRRT